MAVSLLAAVKMPFPEGVSKRAKTERVWLDVQETSACLHVDSRRWCYEHIPPQGARAEMLRVRSEPEGLSVGAIYYYVVDYDLDGLIDVGSTTTIEGPSQHPAAVVSQFFHRGTVRGEQLRADYQKIYDDGIQNLLKYLGE
jgi:hypothetical protein